ncbi:uncharacterized protein C6F6.19-like [Camellia sinensis]|uniref:uncharacterized protein C6F6.19-like n=1 Tax=Camellia sinensis TaxID=4442 RepID=UPI001035A9E3|nr:uncharacterized protein C6F6.19-like [Camellia sinensis]
MAETTNKQPSDEEEEEDYMGDLSQFLPPETTAPSKSSVKDLQDILIKLREEYQYCLFCGCQYESMEALLSNCPGTNEDDH